VRQRNQLFLLTPGKEVGPGLHMSHVTVFNGLFRRQEAPSGPATLPTRQPANPPVGRRNNACQFLRRALRRLLCRSEPLQSPAQSPTPRLPIMPAFSRLTPFASIRATPTGAGIRCDRRTTFYRRPDQAMNIIAWLRRLPNEHDHRVSPTAPENNGTARLPDMEAPGLQMGWLMGCGLE